MILFGPFIAYEERNDIESEKNLVHIKRKRRKRWEKMSHRDCSKIKAKRNGEYNNLISVLST